MCDVLSPSTWQLDLNPKQDIQVRETASHLWFADPGAPTLKAFALQDGHWCPITSLPIPSAP
ncbi:MAG: hypothetical protein GDA41_05885 [Rhodospirillales bacterium]|nr:hypothetical protein [Rhodospirillales bacterium]